jgi:thiosulfate/3-mercaptopyruvate sulfurtransferase
MRSFLTSATLAALLGPTLLAQKPDARASVVVSTAAVAEQLDDPNLVLLHVGERPEYDAGHLPGARFVSLTDIAVSDRTSPGGLVLELPGTEELRRRLAALGIGDKSRVVVYYGNDWVSPATRVIFTLDYAGIPASLMDGGMPQWKRDGRALSTAVPSVKPGELAPLRTRQLVVDAAGLQQLVGKRGVSVVDARDTVFYLGTRAGGRPGAEQRAGHIAGARSVFFGSLFTDQNTLRTADELTALFAAAGIQKGDTVVAYCHIGQQATALILAARSLGHPVLLYDGSFEDWSRRAELPVEKGRP